jgi:exonuclease SbcC
MIISEIQAENILKYAHLKISNIPSQGLIAISGRNESGKSTIGETLCFALFGRTYALEANDPMKLIKWGESSCSISVDFAIKSSQHYRVVRYLDDEGNQGARLTSVSKDGLVLAKGADQVDAAIAELLGFDYDEFIESFYLAQREITTPHPHSHAVKTIAGITPLEQLAGDLKELNVRSTELISKVENDMLDVKSRLSDLSIAEAKLTDLEATREYIISTIVDKENRIVDLEPTAVKYQRSQSVFRSARTGQGIAKVLLSLFFIITIATWAVWGLLTQLPESDIATKLGTWLIVNINEWETKYQSWLFSVGSISSLLLIALWNISATLGSRKIAAQRDTKGIADRLDHSVKEATTDLDPLNRQIEKLLKMSDGRETETSERIAQEGPAEGIHSEVDLVDKLNVLSEKLDRFGAKPDELRDIVAQITSLMEADVKHLDKRLSRLDKEISVERGRVEQAEELVQMLEDFDSKIDEHERQIQTREHALSLLAAAMHFLSNRFNKKVRDLTGKALPLFTNGRYKHLQIDENLNVRVFSSDKHDFMDLYEISSGTQRQIMLAVRLAMVQHLVHTTDGGPQFIFLDEPFAFFDQQRIQSTLQALPEVSEKISQVWIVAQEFPETALSELHIKCRHDLQDLAFDSKEGIVEEEISEKEFEEVLATTA